MTVLTSSSSAPLKQRLLLVFAVVCYLTAYTYAYRDLISPIFSFWGLGYAPLAPQYFWTSVVLCIIPALWMPVRFSRPSLLLFYVQYFLLYIPGSFLVYHSIRPKLPLHDALVLQLMLFFGLSLIQVVYLLPAPALRSIRISAQAFWFAFGAASAVMFGYLAVTLGGSFQIANFRDIYNLRAAMTASLEASGNRFGFYAQTWIQGVILPFLLAVGFWRRRFLVFIPVSLGYVFLFGIGGAKAAILSIVTLPIAYWLLTRRSDRVAVYFLMSLSIMLLMGYVTREFLSGLHHLEFVAVAHFRFLTVPPQTFPQYFDFFQSHPVTHLSHVTGLNKLIAYPYVQDIPYTVGSYFYNRPVGLNSGVWAGDGLSGFGLWGIPLVSVLCGFVFWLIDVCAAELHPAFAALTLSTAAAMFGNNPLFTTIITGGLAWLSLAFMIAERDGRGFVAVPRFSARILGDAERNEVLVP